MQTQNNKKYLVTDKRCQYLRTCEFKGKNYMQNTIHMLLFSLLVVAALSDLIVPVFLGNKYPGYNHFMHTISTLGTSNSPVQKLQCINLVAVGTLFVIFAIGQHFLFESITWAHNFYTIGMVLYDLGCIIAGIFPEDAQGVSETKSGKIHGIASGIGFLFLIMNPLWAVWIKEFQANRILNIAFFIIGLLSFIAFILSENKSKGLLRFTGLYQRINLLILYGALIMNFMCFFIIHGE